ncbi:A disintegrin and metalloproteinase with thrombospondin motifs 6-like [Argopecten irradians]|uniref:A disintegrin and metalloproteinase with thrombospondin motifs 6-like n=1 Tax=Argopecten irradians TaxID=31199 RepID=UPI00371B6C40
MAQPIHRYITVLLLFVTGCTRVYLLKIQDKFKAEFKEYVDIEIENNGRYRRSPEDRSPYPRNFGVRFIAYNDEVSLPLTRNDDVDLNVPIYVNQNGDVIKDSVPVLQNAAFYQNLARGAAFMVEFNDSHINNIFGSLHLHNEEYFLEQTNQTESLEEPANQRRPLNQQSSVYKLYKTKQKNLKYDYVLKDGQSATEEMRRTLDQNFESHVRNKRAIIPYKVELLIVTDFSVYEYWFDDSTAPSASQKDLDAKASIRQFYAFVINAIDVRYKNIVSSSFSLSIVFAGIYISDNIASSSWTENEKTVIGTGYGVNINNVLTNFRNWERSTLGLPDHDHAMLFTKYDFFDGTDNGVAGLAYLDGICSSNKQSVVEDLFDFGMMTIAAHEVGHSLSADHDGVGNACPFEGGYIMAATSTIQTGDTATNPWKFSTCSVSSFQNQINLLNFAGQNCLASLSTNFNATALTPYDQQIPGQIYDADEQCRRIVGDNSYMCRGFYYQDYSSICSRMYCSKADGTNFCSEHVPAYGTSCGNKKWCMSGACVSNTSAPSVSDTCPFGDQEGIVSSGHTCASVVALNQYNCNSTGWYSYCCNTCGALYTGVPGCEYGDRSSQCKAEDCPFYSQANLDICCSSCAVTTITQTTTTTTPRTTPRTTPTTVKETITSTPIKDSTTTTVSDTTTSVSTTPQSTTVSDELVKMLIIGAAVGVAGLLIIIHIAVCICLIYTKKQTNSPHNGSVSPVVDNPTYVPDMYNGKFPSRSAAPTPVIISSPCLSEQSPMASPQVRNGRAQLPALFPSNHLSPPAQKWYPVLGVYTNHALHVENEANPTVLNGCNVPSTRTRNEKRKRKTKRKRTKTKNEERRTKNER